MRMNPFFNIILKMTIPSYLIMMNSQESESG